VVLVVTVVVIFMQLQAVPQDKVLMAAKEWTMVLAVAVLDRLEKIVLQGEVATKKLVKAVMD
jgi:hypothetical protein